MPTCAVYGCGNYSTKTKGSDIRYYSFPKDKILSDQWIDACCRPQNKFNVNQARICSTHFHSSAFFKTLKQRLLNYQPKTCRDLRKDAIPTEFLPNEKLSLNTNTNERHGRREEIKNRKAIIDIILEKVTVEFEDVSHKITVKMEDGIHQEDALNSESFVTPISELNDSIEQLKKENLNLKKNNEILRRNLVSVNNELQSMKTILNQHFGPGQIKHLFNPGKSFQWTCE